MEGSVNIGGDYGHFGVIEQHADAFFRGLELPGWASSALREDNQWFPRMKEVVKLLNSLPVTASPFNGKGAAIFNDGPKNRDPEEFLLGHEPDFSFLTGVPNEVGVQETGMVRNHHKGSRLGD